MENDSTSGQFLPLTEKGLLLYGYLKNFSLSFCQLLNKDSRFKTCSKAHIPAN
jgi:hypothetical protein